MIPRRDNAERICALVLDREPTTLREIEDILGCTLERSQRVPWELRKRRPVPGVAAIKLSFQAYDLATLVADPDPQVDEIDLSVVGADALAVELFGCPNAANHWDRGHGTFRLDKQRLYWVRRHLTASERTPADEDALLDEIATVVDGPLAWNHLETVCGHLELDGYAACLRACRETWMVRVRPMPPVAIELVDFIMVPPLATDRLFATLGWHDVMVGQHRYTYDGRTGLLHETRNGHHVQVQFAHEPNVADIEPGTPYAIAFRDRTPRATFLQVRK